VKPTNIPYFENISESFQDSDLESSSPDFELIHLEDVPLERMRDKRAFRLNAFIVGFLTGGEALLSMNSKDYHLQKGTLYFSTPWHIRQYKKIREWKGYLLFFTPQYLYQHRLPDSRLMEFPFFQSENGVVVAPDDKEVRKLTKLFAEMYDILKSGKLNRFDILFHYANILLLECKSLDALLALPSPHGAENITHLFLEKVNAYFTQLTKGQPQEPLTLTNIARQLHLHPNYLSNLVKSQSGKTVAQVIRARMVLEARALLKNSNMTVSEISYYLQFTDTSNFAKFFKSNTGQSPSVYRANSKSH
jgi:AraC-like DNA-binding protein